MRDLIEIVEAFTEGLDFVWITKSDVFWQADFNIGDDYQYSVRFTLEDDNEAPYWDVDFAQNSDDKMSWGNTGNMGSSSVKVLSTVVQTISDFLVNKEPDILHFTGTKAIPGMVKTFNTTRSTLYGTMLRRMGARIKAMGYDTSLENNSDVYGDFWIKRLADDHKA